MPDDLQVGAAQLLGRAAGFRDPGRRVHYGDIHYLPCRGLFRGVFQIIASYVVFFLNAVFTIIYTIRIYSYLHNKRKADMYGALPISRRTFYVAKTVSAYIFSLVPTMFFLSVIALISVCFGQPLVNEVTSLYLNLLLGSIACVSFYGLLAVCCGTTVNSVIAFIAINFAYVVAAMFIKGTVMSFLHGMPLMIYENSFIMKALNPLSAYSGGNIAPNAPRPRLPTGCPPTWSRCS